MMHIHKYNLETGSESRTTILPQDDDDYAEILIEMHNKTLPNVYYWGVRVFEAIP